MKATRARKTTAVMALMLTEDFRLLGPAERADRVEKRVAEVSGLPCADAVDVGALTGTPVAARH